jgi:hypothetical protein
MKLRGWSQSRYCIAHIWCWPDAGRPDHVVPVRGQLLEGLEHLLRLERVAAFAVPERELVAPRLDPPQPRLGRVPAALVAQLPDLDGELGEDLLQRSDHRHVRAPELVDLGRVDVEMDDRRPGCKGVELAGHAVVEARSDGDEHVAGVHRQV